MPVYLCAGVIFGQNAFIKSEQVGEVDETDNIFAMLILLTT